MGGCIRSSSQPKFPDLQWGDNNRFGLLQGLLREFDELSREAGAAQGVARRRRGSPPQQRVSRREQVLTNGSSDEGPKRGLWG